MSDTPDKHPQTATHAMDCATDVPADFWQSPRRRDVLKGSLALGVSAGLAVAGSEAIAQGDAPAPLVAKVDVVVVGAGLSGLAAARNLTRAGKLVAVLEGRDRVGGRAYTEPSNGGSWIDMGAQFIGPGQDRILALAEELGVKHFPFHVSGNGIIVLGGKRGRFSMVPSEEYPDLTAEDVEDALSAVHQLDEMAKQVPASAPWKAPKAREWDSQTLASWMAQNMKTTAAKSMMRIFINGYLTSEPADVSLLHVLFYISSGGGFESLHLGGLAWRFEGGVGQLSIGMAKELGAAVHLNTAVQRVDQANPNYVLVQTDRGTFQCQRVVVACSPAMANLLQYNPPMPSNRMQFVQRVGMGSTIKCHFVYPAPFWRARGMSGIVYSDSTVVGVIADNSPPSGTPGILVAFIEAQHSRDYSCRPENEILKAALDGVVAFHGPEAANPIQSFIKVWDADPWARGCYSGVMAPSVRTDYPDTIRTPVDRIHWAGTETADRWYAYMDGAVRSGERASAEVVAAL
jgi:monoamine oxidase